MIKFYLGRSGVGKSYQMLKEIKKEIEIGKNDKLFLIVPEQYTLQGEMDLIHKMGLPGLLDFEVISFNRLISRVIEALGGLQTTSINTLGKTMLLRKIFNDRHDDLTVFAKAHRQYGFLEEVSETIAELKRANISSDLLTESATKVEKDPLIKGKLEDLSLVFQAYQEGLEDKYTDDEDRINYVLEVLSLWSDIQGAHVWIDGFSGFTAQEYQLINKMSTICESLTIALTTELSELCSDADIFGNTKGAYLTIKGNAEEAGVPFEIKELTEFKRSKEILHLERNFFAFPYNKYDGKVEAIELHSATDKKEELEWIATELVDLVFHHGYEWKDMMVVVSDVEQKAPLIHRLFKQYQIPYFVDMKRDVLNNSFIRLVQNSMQSVLTYFKQKEVIEVLKSGFMPLSLAQINELETYVLKRGITGRRWFNYDNHDPEYLGFYLSKLMSPLQAFYEGAKKAKTVKDFTKLLLDYLNELEVIQRIESIIVDAEGSDQHELALEYTQIWNKFIEVIDQLVEIGGTDAISLKDYIQLLDAGFSEMELGVIPPKENLVTIGSINRSKSHEVKAIFLSGLNDGEVPKIREEYGLLSNDDKGYLLSEGYEIKSTVDFRNREEAYNLYQILSKPTDKIYFSYCRQDGEGKALRPSLYVGKLHQVFPKLKEAKNKLKEDPKRLLQCGEEILVNKATEQLKRLIEGESVTKEWLDALSWLKTESTDPVVEQVINGYYYTNQAPPLLKELAASLYELPLQTSTSKLERYVECPFAYFVRYGLNPKERQLHEVKLPDIGLVFHEALEKFGKKLQEDKLDFRTIEETEIERIVVDVVDSFIADYGYNVFSANNANKYLVEKIKRVVKRAAWAIVRQLKRGQFEPRAFEVEFSNSLKEDTVPPIIVTTKEGEKILLEGRIDRVDILDGDEKKYVKIIDYKSSSKSYALSDVYHGLQMQLMIYMDAILENSQYFREDALEPCGAFYFKIDDPIVEGDMDGALLEEEIFKKLKLEGLAVADADVLKQLDESLESTGQSSIVSVQLNEDDSFKKTSKVVEAEDFNEIIKHVKVKISEIGSAIMGGQINIEPINTGTRKACDYCPYKGLCQFDQKICGNEFKRIKKYKDNEVLDIIKSKGSDLDA